VAAHRVSGLADHVVVEITGGKSLSIVVRDLQPLPAATGMRRQTCCASQS
jgi:hypothetical protein